MRRILGFAVALLALLAYGCEDPTGSINNSNKVTVTVTVGNVGMSSSGFTLGMCPESGYPLTKQLTAVLAPDTSSVKVTWLSGDTLVAKVSSTGLVTPVGPGSTRIFVKAGSSLDHADVTVVKCPTTSGPGERVFTRIDYAPPGGTYSVGSGATLVATCYDQFNAVMACPTLTWVSSEVDDVSVSASGVLVCVSQGQSEVSVRTPNGGPSKSYPFNCTGTTQQNTFTVAPNPLNVYMPCTPSLGSSTGTLVLRMNGTPVTSGVQWLGQNGNIATVTSSGQVTAVSPGTITVQGVGPQGVGNGTIVVHPCTSTPNPSPTLSLTANPANILAGQNSVLTWSSSNATSCTASGGWNGNKPVSGTETVTPAQTTSYSLTCTGAGGSVTQSATVIVSSVPSNPSVTVTGPTSFTCIAGQTFSVPLSVVASGGASTAGTFSLVSSNATGAAQVLTNWSQQGNTLSGNCLAPGTVNFRWTSTSMPAVTHNIVGTITAGTVTCLVTVNGQQVTTVTVAIGANQNANVVCQNQFGATILPFGHSSNPERVGIKGTQSVVIQGQTFWAGYTFNISRIASGNATLTIQAEITNPTPIATIAVN